MKQKVLVVDDDPVVSAVLAQWLEQENFQVLTACDGWEGISQAATHVPDLIITDILMPRMDGFELKMYLDSDPVLRKIPVIFVSMIRDRRDPNRPRRKLKSGFGVADYLTKPVSPERLKKAVNGALN